MTDHSRVSLPARLLRPILLSLIMFSIWLLLTDGQSPVFGAVAVSLAVVLNQLLIRPRVDRWRPWRLPLFAGFFLYLSLLAGLDIARRAFNPAATVSPGWIEYRYRLPAGTARTLFINAISLMPGTLSADLREHWVRVHLLVSDSDPLADLIRLERQIAALFALPYPVH